MIVKKREKMADTNLKEFKSQLAKLMANENIQIEHQKISTAKFDVKNRVLYLPIWTDMTGYTYDLLCGHEVGHALFTPEEGWHDAVVDKAKGKNYKNFLNVVEDARIEKRVQRKYPGLKQSFKKAYADLMKKDFFGIGKRDINSFPFIDRLNLFTKSQYVLPVDFDEYETKLLEKVKAAESWDDVVAVTKEIYDYSKDEQLDYEDELSFDINLGDDEELEADDEFDSEDNKNTIEPDAEAEDKKEVEDDSQASGSIDGDEEDKDKQQGGSVREYVVKKDDVIITKIPDVEVGDSVKQVAEILQQYIVVAHHLTKSLYPELDVNTHTFGQIRSKIIDQLLYCTDIQKQ